MLGSGRPPDTGGGGRVGAAKPAPVIPKAATLMSNIVRVSESFTRPGPQLWNTPSNGPGKLSPRPERAVLLGGEASGSCSCRSSGSEGTRPGTLLASPAAPGPALAPASPPPRPAPSCRGRHGDAPPEPGASPGTREAPRFRARAARNPQRGAEGAESGVRLLAAPASGLDLGPRPGPRLRRPPGPLICSGVWLQAVRPLLWAARPGHTALTRSRFPAGGGRTPRR